MSNLDKSTVMRNLDVTLSILDSLEYMLEHNAGLKDMHSLACLAGEGRRKINSVVDVLADHI